MKEIRLWLRNVAPNLHDELHANVVESKSPLSNLSGPSWRLLVLIQAAGWLHSHYVGRVHGGCTGTDTTPKQDYFSLSSKQNSSVGKYTGK